MDKTDPLLLRLTLPGGLGQSEASPFGAGFLLSLRFEARGAQAAEAALALWFWRLAQDPWYIQAFCQVSRATLEHVWRVVYFAP